MWALRPLFGLKRGDVSGEWRTLNNGKVYDLCSPNISVKIITKFL
jgi:hypothetical protein